MASNPQANDYEVARKVLLSAVEAYRANPNAETLMAVYHAQSQVRNASTGLTGSSGKEVTPKDLASKLDVLRQPELVPGERLDYAHDLYVAVQMAIHNGGGSPELANAQTILDQYIQTAWARIEDNDSKFASDYTRITGQPPAPGQFDSGQTINGNVPTPQPQEAGPYSPVTKVPDAGVRPGEYQVHIREKPPKRARGEQDLPRINIEPLPDYAPYDVLADYRQSGLDTQPGTGPTIQQIPGMGSPSPSPSPSRSFAQGASDSVNAADQTVANTPTALRDSVQYHLFRSGLYYGSDRDAVQSGRLVFTGYQTRNTKYIDDENPRFGSQIITTKTPSYQSAYGLTYALGKPGFPTIAEYQKKMGLPVTGTLDDKTLNAWQSTVGEAAMNTAGNRNMTVQEAMEWQVKRAQWYAAQQRAAMAAAYNVDPTASAAVLGAAMKQVTGRLSTAAEDAEFHKAFNSANISTQGKVDAQQFARDWVRNKYPTEAGTMLGQDYYGAMFDVLTAGPGSLGSEAASVNG